MRKLKDEEIIENVLKQYPNSKVLNIKRINKKNKIRIIVEFICGVCGYHNESLYDNIKKSRGCKICGINKYKENARKYTTSFIEEELYKLGFKWLNKNEYVDASSSLKTECLKCGKISKANVVNRVIEGRQCSRCLGLERKNIEEFKKEVYESEGNDYIVLSEYYTNAHDRNILIKHSKCNNEYYISRSDFRRGTRCPICNESKGENKIRKYLDNKGINFEQQKKFKELRGVGNGLLSYDFYLPQYNLLIEYQGEYHDGSVSYQTDEGFKQQQEHDKRKREYAKQHNINLLEIWYWDFDNIEEILFKELFDNGR